MAPANPKSKSSKSDDRKLDASPAAAGQSRVIISLLLVIHLFLVVLGLSANYSPSPLQQRILQSFAFYTRSLNFDLNYTRYHLTHASAVDVDHRIEILPSGRDPQMNENWIVLPDVGFRGGERYKRYQRLARTLSFFSQDEVTAALLVQAIATNVYRQQGIEPQQVRSQKHLLQSVESLAGEAAERDPNSHLYFDVPYAANCVINDDQTINVVKVDVASQVAQPNAPANNTPANNDPARSPSSHEPSGAP